MEIKTKYDVGDTIFYLDTEETRIKSIVIGYVSACFNGEQSTVSYYPKGSLHSVGEERAFPSREALLERLSHSQE